MRKINISLNIKQCLIIIANYKTTIIWVFVTETHAAKCLHIPLKKYEKTKKLALV